MALFLDEVLRDVFTYQFRYFTCTLLLIHILAALASRPAATADLATLLLVLPADLAAPSAPSRILLAPTVTLAVFLSAPTTLASLASSGPAFTSWHKILHD